MTPIQSNVAASLLEGIRVTELEVRLTLDRPVRLWPLATPPMRGLSGWLLAEHDPDVAAVFFKPGENGNAVPAYVVQWLATPAEISDTARYRWITWDPERRLADSLARLWPKATGMPFGGAGARVADLRVEARREAPLCAMLRSTPSTTIDVELRTPVRIKAGGGRWLGPGDLTASALLTGIARRLNALSATYGNGETIALESLGDGAAQIVHRDLRWVTPERRSSPQGTAIKLSGIVGRMQLSGVIPDAAALLEAATWTHVGKHTSDGCGRIILDRFPRTP